MIRFARHLSIAWTLMLGLASLLASASAHATEKRDGAVGLYRLTGVQDAASMLEITADGRWRYGLSYGALDEEGDGRWRRDGGRLLLDTDPRPVPPAFTQHAVRWLDQPEMRVLVVGPGGRGIAGIDIVVRFDRGDPVAGYTQQDGWSMALPPDRRPVAVVLSLDMFGVAGSKFAVDAARGNDLEFLFTPNDLGRPDFRDLPVEVEGDALVMLRDGARLRYVRVKD